VRKDTRWEDHEISWPRTNLNVYTIAKAECPLPTFSIEVAKYQDKAKATCEVRNITMWIGGRRTAKPVDSDTRERLPREAAFPH